MSVESQLFLCSLDKLNHASDSPRQPFARWSRGASGASVCRLSLPGALGRQGGQRGRGGGLSLSAAVTAAREGHTKSVLI